MYGSLPMQQIKFMGHLISMLDKLSIIIGEVLLIMCAAALGLVQIRAQMNFRKFEGSVNEWTFECTLLCLNFY